MRLGFIFGLVFLMPAFVFQLAFDSVNFQFTSSRILQAVNLFCSVYGAALIMASRQSQEIVKRCRPALFLVGLAFVSCIWSMDSMSTIRGSFLLLSTTLFALAMASRLSPKACLQTIIWAFILVCALSIIWVFLFPQEAVHQATDRVQSVHAGLWRGVTSHKQGLGVVSGLGFGFLAFYTSIFPVVITVIGLVCTMTCVLGSGSTTGLMTAFILPAMLYMTYWIVLSPKQARKGALYMLGGSLAFLYFAFHFGVLDFVMPLLGKSADLTGRADQWPWAIEMIKSKAPFLGGGYSSGWEEAWVPTFSIDNGYIEILGTFGYLGSVFVFSVYGWAFLAGAGMIRSAGRETARLDVLPFNIMFIELFLNVSEASFMTPKTINTILICVAICHIVRHRSAGQAGAGARQASGLRQPAGLRPNSLGQPARRRPGG